MPLPDDMVIDTLPRVGEPVSRSSVSVTPSARLEALLDQEQSSTSEGTSEHEGRMEPGIIETKSETESADVLLDLGDIAPAHASDSDEFVRSEEHTSELQS